MKARTIEGRLGFRDSTAPRDEHGRPNKLVLERAAGCEVKLLSELAVDVIEVPPVP
jgi:hypothetical protein